MIKSPEKIEVPVSPKIVWRTPTGRLLLLYVCVAVPFLLINVIEVLLRHPGPGESMHFVYLADGWLHGHLYLNTVPPSTADYTFQNGHWWVAFPPLPAILMLPLVAIF